ncbi:uncharacterized protein Z519_10927 [Cladophialophora bantiana CBS 173.52]|uniref:Uncharacterized protein n=1 Tax=Cladophialophora bantiana (strain ATCC 10958 / CBS 173.52 / CDC B-1940 / NIH 8579) TaxID=1442370 RepID=A0A0D2HUZ9_CLAB1|nr:uncharacterized protein Z519_10927 [Cladophialophora bantiana CBS 173.52]KIW88359.1 hypothetical protein Z519_10927 [Cladophialophora bantiana CBS 173.52]
MGGENNKTQTSESAIDFLKKCAREEPSDTWRGGTSAIENPDMATPQVALSGKTFGFVRKRVSMDRGMRWTGVDRLAGHKAEGPEGSRGRITKRRSGKSGFTLIRRGTSAQTSSQKPMEIQGHEDLLSSQAFCPPLPPDLRGPSSASRLAPPSRHPE